MKKYIKIVCILVFLNIAITSIIQRLKCPKKTETELLFLLPSNFIYNFNRC